MVILVLLVIGALVGLVSSFFGVGACFIMVPVMITVLERLEGVPPNVAPLIAFGTNMAIVVPTALSGAFRHEKKLRSKEYHFPWKNYIWFVIPVVIGSVIGSLSAYVFFISYRAFAGLILKTLFGIMCLIGAYRFMRARPLELHELKEPDPKLYTAGGLVSGFLANFMGIGGGLVYMPVLNAVLAIPVLFAVEISLSTMVIGSAVGSSMFGLLGSIDQAANPSSYPAWTFGWFNLELFLVIGVASIIFAQIGPHLAHKTNPKQFKILLAAVYVYVGIRLVVNGFLQLQGLPALIP